MKGLQINVILFFGLYVYFIITFLICILKYYKINDKCWVNIMKITVEDILLTIGENIVKSSLSVKVKTDKPVKKSRQCIKIFSKTQYLC